MSEVYKVVLQDQFNSKTKGQREDIKQVSLALEKSNNELKTARTLLLSNEIEVNEYRLIKIEYERKITGLESKLFELTMLSSNIDSLSKKSLNILSNLDELYEKADNKRKREIIGSIYPEKLVFDGFQYRTARLNEAVSLIYSLDKGFSQNKTGQNERIFNLSGKVENTGFEPVTSCMPCKRSTN